MMKTLVTTIMLTLLLPLCVNAASLKKIKTGFEVSLEDIDLPKKHLNKKFKSGLETNLFYIISMLGEKQEVLIKKENFSVRFDLWDEAYYFKIGLKNKKLQNLKEVYTLLEDLTLKINKQALQKLNNNVIKIKTVVVLNPVNKRKSQKIKEWMAEKNVGQGSHRNGAGGVTSVFSGIVNRVVMNDLDKDIYSADKKFIFLSPEIDLTEVK